MAFIMEDGETIARVFSGMGPVVRELKIEGFASSTQDPKDMVDSSLWDPTNGIKKIDLPFIKEEDLPPVDEIINELFGQPTSTLRPLLASLQNLPERAVSAVCRASLFASRAGLF
ncbi:hypothetical protein HYS91_00520 [Candidatus Daviesbacteria bacterium]|nr:hypothetical protein [Candidatus Daviesbacteria bacterium]